jgi:hypothetical protein
MWKQEEMASIPDEPATQSPAGSDVRTYALAAILVIPAAAPAYLGHFLVARLFTNLPWLFVRMFGVSAFELGKIVAGSLANLMFGLIAGCLALAIAMEWKPRLNPTSMALAVCAIWAVIYAIGLGIAIYFWGPDQRVLTSIAALCGLAAGAFLAVIAGQN